MRGEGRGGAAIFAAIMIQERTEHCLALDSSRPCLCPLRLSIDDSDLELTTLRISKTDLEFL